MGTDIYGWAEERSTSRGWKGLWRLHIHRNYGLFAALFDERNSGHLIPLAARRGIPEDASDEFRREFAGESPEDRRATWVGLWELLRFHWRAEVQWPAIEIEIVRKTDAGLVPHCIRVE
jgi:hypothetical protein